MIRLHGSVKKHVSESLLVFVYVAGCFELSHLTLFAEVTPWIINGIAHCSTDKKTRTFSYRIHSCIACIMSGATENRC